MDTRDSRVWIKKAGEGNLYQTCMVTNTGDAVEFLEALLLYFFTVPKRFAVAIKGRKGVRLVPGNNYFCSLKVGRRFVWRREMLLTVSEAGPKPPGATPLVQGIVTVSYRP
jgi:hypothetical protein